MKQIGLKLDYLKTVNYALYHNKIPVCQSIDITNLSNHSLTGLRLSVEGEFITIYECEVISHLGAGHTIRVSAFEISPKVEKLTTLTERISSIFTLNLSSEGQIIHTEQYEIDFLPYDYWLGLNIMPQTLVSFITPNHPAVNAIVVKAAEVLKKISGSSVLVGYQTGNTNDVRTQVAAVFGAIHSLGIIYRGVPASYEETGQRISLPDYVLSSKIGNCIELTLLFASVLEAIGINTLVVIQKTHAYLAVWLVDDCYPCGTCDDVSFIEKAISRGIDEMLVLECTLVAQENVSFQDAICLAEKNLADFSQFELFIDVKRCRMERVLPLPLRVQTEDGWRFDTEGVEHDKCFINITQHDRYDLNKIADSSKVLSRFDIWERKLLDFSLRNSLLNLNLRRRAIQFISFDINRIEDHLQDGDEYSIGYKPNVDLKIDDSERLVRSKMYVELRDLVISDINHHRLHSYYSEAETKDVLKNIYRSSRNSLEETGANALFLSIGTLRWFETPASQTARYAPILLLPVEMVYKKGNYYIRTRDEGITLNITLKEFLAQNYDIKIKGLDVLPKDDSGVDVPLVFAAIRDALKEKKGWDVEEECLLGTFSFSKFLMWNDIHYHRKELSENKVINSLVENRMTWVPEPVSTELKALDRQISPSNLALPLSVDSSQMAAVIEAGKGHSFILHGPPGTGKSQTITNLIANALYQGKRVLFVAEKMAALSVVQSRLAKLGLDPFCLELHSNKSTKRHVLQQLDKSLNVAHIVSPSEFATTADKIFEQRKELIAYMEALHNVDAKDGLSLYDCILYYESIRGQALDNFTYEPELDSLLAREGVKAIEDILGSRFETVIKLVGQPSEHPLNGLSLEKESLMQLDAFVLNLLAEKDTIAKAKQNSKELNEAKSLRDKLLRDNKPELLEEDAMSLYQEWREARAKWFVPRFFAKRSFIAKLRKYNQLIVEKDIDGLLDDLMLYGQKHSQIEELKAILRKRFNIETALDELPNANTMEACIAKLETWASHKAQMRDWLHWSEYSDSLRQNGMGSVVEAMQKTKYEPNTLRNSYIKALFMHKIEERMRGSKLLASFEGMLFDDKVETYRRMSEEFQLLTQKELYAKLAARVPRLVDNLDSSSEIGLLKRNISNGGRGLSLRDLFEQMPTLLPRLCPCMLMSPMSVAQYLNLAQEKFDLVVFDEASQMPTSEAVGAIARGKSLIVVGDPKQMPPTSFFSSSNVDEEEASIDDMESILEDCQTLGISALQLSWHYRSRHESLIAFSNNEYYEGSLITFPSADDQYAKVHYVPVKGYYDKGGRRQNKSEAEVIIREIERRLKDETLRTKSIGVIAFSVVQQSLIEDMLQSLLDSSKALHEAAESMYEPIFVKNLENVQGDERDVILFSIGYGPDKTGKVSMNFGPLNNAGGERRLNVAVSRAREEMYVYSTLKAADIDLRRSKARGVEGLKHFLDYAQTQSLPTNSESQFDSQDNLLAGQIAEALKERGYEAKTKLGRSQFKVDVAVGDKDGSGEYRLGILLDGDSYRDTHTTRDREIVQPSVLNSLNWQLMRVWSVDWYNNKERVIKRIEERLAASPKKKEPASKQVFVPEEAQLETIQQRDTDYKTCNLSVSQANAMSDKKLMQSIISIEQPINFMYLCRRVCALRESGRVTVTLQRNLSENLGAFYLDENQSIWLRKADCEAYDGYRTNSGRDVADIPQVELINALMETLKEQIALNEDSLVLIAAKKLGFTRRGANLQSAFTKAVKAMAEKGLSETIGGNIRLKTK